MPDNTQAALGRKEAARLADLVLNPEGRNIGVLGLGVTGQATARLLGERGATLTLIDDNAAAYFEAPWQNGRNCRWILGLVSDHALEGCEAVAVSPGINPKHPQLIAAQRNQVLAFGELDLLQLRRPPARIVAITGTNGKSSTTALVGTLLRGLGHDVFVGGNLGDPIAGWLAAGAKEPGAVLELSSYNIDLDAGHSFAPAVAVILNITADHLERYGTLMAYASSKEQLLRALAPDGTAILNADDSLTRAIGQRSGKKVWWFGQGALPPGASGLTLVGDLATPVGEVTKYLTPFNLTHPRLLGRHSRLNAMAALLAVCAFDAAACQDMVSLSRAYLDFSGLAHRLVPVGEVNDVLFVNDSKATNDASAAIALRAMSRPTVLLLGGKDKGGGYSELDKAMRCTHMRATIAYGAAQPQIVAALGQAHKLFLAQDMQQACALALALACPGDAILLAPACSSFDAFSNFVERGNVFERWVLAHAASAARPAGP